MGFFSHLKQTKKHETKAYWNPVITTIPENNFKNKSQAQYLGPKHIQMSGTHYYTSRAQACQRAKPASGNR